VGIAVDAIRLAKKVDSIVLVTGDGDFVPLVEHLKQDGVQVEVVSFGKSTSSKLKDAAEAFLDLCDEPEKYLLMSKSRMVAKKTSNNNSRQPRKRVSKNDTQKNDNSEK
jgi:uncharacterized LabA/DUF88 family protein